MLAKVMNWVSRHILLALFMCLFLLLSCGSSHKAIKSDTEVISKDSASETVNIVHESTTSLSELITTNGSYVINFGFMIQESLPTVLPGNLRYWLTVMQKVISTRRRINRRWQPILQMSKLIRKPLPSNMKKLRLKR